MSTIRFELSTSGVREYQRGLKRIRRLIFWHNVRATIRRWVRGAIANQEH